MAQASGSKRGEPRRFIGSKNVPYQSLIKVWLQEKLLLPRRFIKILNQRQVRVSVRQPVAHRSNDIFAAFGINDLPEQ